MNEKIMCVVSVLDICRASGVAGSHSLSELVSGVGLVYLLLLLV